MRIGIIAFTLILVVLVGWVGHSNSQPADGKSPQVDPERIQKLIRNLGSSVFAVRNQATVELEKLGAAALEPLRKAAKSGDRELSDRASELLNKVETRILTERMLAPKRVRLAVKDATVQEAVAELARLSGYSLEVTGEKKDQKITLDTGETTFWEALKLLCAKADLHDVVPVQAEPARAPMVQGGGKIVINIGNLPNAGGKQPNPPNPVLPAPPAPQPDGRDTGKIRLTPGALEQPAHLTGSVRIRAVPAGKTAAGETQIMLEASAEPRLKDFGIVALPILEKAIDDQGQVLVNAPAPAPAQNPNQGGFGGNGIAVINGQVFVNGQLVGANVPKKSSVPLALKLGEKPSKTLKEISGTLVFQALKDEREALVTVNNLLKAAGTKVKGKDEHQLQIIAVEKLADGDIKIQLALQKPGGQNPGNLLGGKGGVAIANINGKVIINGVPLGAVGNSPLSPQEYPKLTDVKGAAHAPVSGREINGKTYELIYRLQAEPAQLIYYGQGRHTFAVPFVLKNVPLP